MAGHVVIAAGELGASQLGLLVEQVNGRDYRYFYSADDERIGVVERVTDAAMVVRNRPTWTVRGFGNELLSVWKDPTTAGADTVVWASDEIHRGSQLLGESTPTGIRHYTLDHLGSPRVVTDASGNLVGLQAFDPFGLGGTKDGGPLQYTGPERDAALIGGGDLHMPDYMHARYYDAGGGRFLSVDPVLDVKRAMNTPQLWNRYAYVLNKPINRVDPDGRTDECPTCSDEAEESRVRLAAQRGDEFA